MQQGSKETDEAYGLQPEDLGTEHLAGGKIEVWREADSVLVSRLRWIGDV